jgi:hypothetical protein
MHKITLALFTLLAILAFCTETKAQTQIKLVQAENSLTANKPNGVRYHYRFENERFTTPLQEIEFDGQGQGTFRFKRKDSDEVVNKLEVSSSLLSQIQVLFDSLNFLSSSEDYQHKKDFSHLGTVTISFARGGKERTVKFNYTTNELMSQLREVFQNLTTQETRIFELESVRENDPLSSPAQLRMLESELRSKHIADPQRFVPILQDLKLDESVPLITRNHADRLLQTIKKGK